MVVGAAGRSVWGVGAFGARGVCHTPESVTPFDLGGELNINIATLSENIINVHSMIIKIKKFLYTGDTG